MIEPDILSQFENIEGIEDFSFVKTQCWARLLDVYDGDTLTVAMHFNNKLCKLHIRLIGIDTPEMKSKDMATKAKAIIARNTVIAYLTGNPDWQTTPMIKVKDVLKVKSHMIWIQLEKNDKYGRPLGYVSKGFGEPTINQHLIDTRLAMPYFGGSKNVGNQ